MDYYNNELYHFGVKGMKWGVRRYQNKDGTLTDKGKKRYSDEYKKEMIKYQKDSLATARSLNVAAYNKTADEYNNGKIKKFNETHDSKSPTYMDDYAKQFEQDYRRNFDKMKLHEMENNKHYQKAKKICDKYGLLEFDELAQKNDKWITDLRNKMESGKTSWDD